MPDEPFQLRRPRSGDTVVYYDFADGSRELVGYPAIVSRTADPRDNSMGVYLTVFYTECRPARKGYVAVPFSPDPFPGHWGWPSR